ncbi:nucleoside hydrolase [Anaerotruncus rubiinfantis]|uniref:nucleoside hydrolase n=1 Tax=Anaerotruncus rubiinfantis TaxID=1720200 RepID=UPI0008346313|nr:nucleoside hydrolase [Anaerotruncus rubiinfantis]
MIYKQPGFPVPPEKMIRVITSTDAKNEADDQYAIVQTLLSPRFDNRGIVAAHFGQEKSVASMLDSYHEVEKLFGLMGLEPQILRKGAEHALPDEQTPVPSEGARLIIEEALREDARPFYVTVLGPLTDLASACLLCPEIVGRFTAIWIGGGRYPKGGMEYNLKNDLHAANVVMDAGLDLWQVPEDVYQQMLVSLAELRVRVKPHGAIGDYLFTQMVEWGQTYFGKRSSLRTGECWYLGDSPVVGLMLNEHPNDYDLVPAPHIAPDMTYQPSKSEHMIRVYRRIDSRFVLEDLYAKLQLFIEEPGEMIY